jgi:hypothetical protein
MNFGSARATILFESFDKTNDLSSLRSIAASAVSSLRCRKILSFDFSYVDSYSQLILDQFKKVKARKTYSTCNPLKHVAIAFSVARSQTVTKDNRVINGSNQNCAISLHELGIINELDGPKYFLLHYSYGLASIAAHGRVTFN